MKTSSLTLGAALGVGLFAVGIAGAVEPTFAGFAALLVMVVTPSFLLAHLAERNLMPAAVLVILFALAYCPGALAATTTGIDDPAIPATPESVQLALLVQALFLSGVAITVIRVAFSWPSPPRAALRFLRVVDAGRSPTIVPVLYGFLLVATVASFRIGSWSYYGGRQPDEHLGGFQFSLLYEPLLLAGFVVAGRKMGRAFLEPGLDWTSVVRWFFPWLLTLALIFLYQSRRLMIAGLLMGTLDPAMWAARAGLLDRVPRPRMLILGAVSSVIAGLLFLGSTLWRENRNPDAASWNEAIPMTIQGMSQSNLDIDKTATQASDRLRYLWLDAVSIDKLFNIEGFGSLSEAFVSALSVATPGIIFSEKYDVPSVTCENAFQSLSVEGDLSCTPTAEGLIFGGAWGFSLVTVVFGLGIALACLFHGSGSDTGLILSACVLNPHVIIECSAFPILQSLRSLLIVSGLLAFGCWSLRLLSRQTSRQT